MAHNNTLTYPLLPLKFQPTITETTNFYTHTHTHTHLRANTAASTPLPHTHIHNTANITPAHDNAHKTKSANDTLIPVSRLIRPGVCRPIIPSPGVPTGQPTDNIAIHASTLLHAVMLHSPIRSNRRHNVIACHGPWPTCVSPPSPVAPVTQFLSISHPAHIEEIQFSDHQTQRHHSPSIPRPRAFRGRILPSCAAMRTWCAPPAPR